MVVCKKFIKILVVICLILITFLTFSFILNKYNTDVFIHTWFDPENLSTNSVIPGRESHRLDSQAIDKLSN